MTRLHETHDGDVVMSKSGRQITCSSVTEVELHSQDQVRSSYSQSRSQAQVKPQSHLHLQSQTSQISKTQPQSHIPVQAHTASMLQPHSVIPRDTHQETQHIQHGYEASAIQTPHMIIPLTRDGTLTPQTRPRDFGASTHTPLCSNVGDKDRSWME